MNGFYRVASCVPVLRVADPVFNTREILKRYLEADAHGCALVLFPELCVTGYTCGDLFEQRTLLEAAEKAVAELARATAGRHAILVVGTPVRLGSRLFNGAAVLGQGRLLGLPLKEYLPNYREFYEKRQFRSAREYELVYVHRTVYDGAVTPSGELDGGRFWTRREILGNLGKGVFTPNFEGEVKLLFPSL